MDGANKVSLSEDEEDLEALRLAALQTLKKNPTTSQALPNNSAVGPRTDGEFSSYRSGKHSHGKFTNKRGRFYGGRGKNGQFTGRAVSSNLISLTPSIPREEHKPKGIQESKSDPPLLLPQDRYCNKKRPDSQESKPEEGSSKFDRYKDSDKSDEEDSEDEALRSDSDDDSPAKLVKSDSLEALMQELDDEILGRTKAKEEKSVKVKTKVKRKKESSKTETEEELEENEVKTEISTMQKEDSKELPEIVDEVKLEKEEPTKEKNSSDIISKSLSPKDVSDAIPRKQRPIIETEPQLKKRRHALPSPQRDTRGYRGNVRRSPPLLHPLFLTGTGALPFPPNNPPIFPPSNLMINPPPLYERPLSPLLINAETLQNQTMAPLSPRSAAFVLENRAIIEKRKRSPRRSYSRSPSPRRRSLSPRRSLTPLRRRSMSPRKRSVSPRKRSLSPRKRSLSPTRKRSRSPKRRSVSPKRRSPSPKRRTFSPKHRALSPKIRTFSPKRTSSSPKRRSLSPRRRDRKDITENVTKNKPSIRERLGFKTATKPEERDSKEKIQSDLSPRKEDKPLDPILEARKKKFEVGEIKIREGVIRLKPKDDVKPEQKPKAQICKEEVEAAPVEAIVEKEETQEVREEDMLREEALLEDDELDLEAQVDLFSDEDSGSENEGRFKTKQRPGAKSPTLPKSKVMNGAKQEVKNGQLSENKRKQTRTPSRNTRETNNDQKSTNYNISPENTSSSRSKVRSSRSDKSLSPRKKLGVKAERHPKKFERKIEIKIKNPSKYERLDKVDGDKEGKADKERGSRKVELGTVGKHGGDEDDDETEILVENDEDEVENAISNEGDLRAQLSKKRAEKLQKTTSREEVTSRLLQNALQNALPIKKSKKSKSKELSSSDGKVPIHLRLGLACSSDVFAKPKRKSKKRKNVETEDQV